MDDIRFSGQFLYFLLSGLLFFFLLMFTIIHR